MRRNNGKRHQQQPRKGKVKKRDFHNLKQQASGSKPTLLLSAQTLISPTFSSGLALYQVNIAPTISAFPRAYDQLKFYQQYRIRKISYDILPVKNVNAIDQNLLYLYDVPINGNEIPTVSDLSYLAFNNVRVTLLDHQI